MRLFAKRRIYLDHASAPPVRPEAIRAMKEAGYVGNPGAIHAEGVIAKQRLEAAREGIALHIGCKAREVAFTSGLTEANTTAIVGYARTIEMQRRGLAGTHWLVSAIEHPSVLESFAEVERLGGSVTHISPNDRGIFSADAISKMLKPETVYISIGWANNEIGTVQPLSDIASAIRAHEKKNGTHIVFHSDAGQAPLYRPTLVQSLGVDLLALGSNKLYGPHGIGALIIRNRIELAPTIFGGRQERGIRPGTENVALAAGFAAAFEASVKDRESETKRLSILRDELWRGISKEMPDAVQNGDLKHSLPHMLNISIPDISSEYAVLALDQAGIAVSTKSACREGEESRSHVVKALSDEDWRAVSTIRFSLGRDTRSPDISRVVHILPLVAKAARK